MIKKLLLILLLLSIPMESFAVDGLGIVGGGTKPVAIRPLNWAPTVTSVWGMNSTATLGLDSVGNHHLTITGPTFLASAGQSREPIEGYGVGNFDGTLDRLEIPDASLGDLDISGVVNFFYACWILMDVDQSGFVDYVMSHQTDINTLTGYALYQVSTAPSIFRCNIGNGSANLTTNATGVAIDSFTGYWHWAACSIVGGSGTSGSLTACNNYECNTVSSLNTTIADDDYPFMLGSDFANTDIDGKLEECIIDVNQNLGTSPMGTDGQGCRICSLGIHGQRGECDPTSPTMYKPCSSNSDCVDNLCVIEDSQGEEDNCTSSGNGTDGCCMGYNDWNITSPMTAAGLDCGSCDLIACNAARP